MTEIHRLKLAFEALLEAEARGGTTLAETVGVYDALRVYCRQKFSVHMRKIHDYTKARRRRMRRVAIGTT